MTMILSVSKIPHKRNYINLYCTTDGDFDHNELAEYIGIEPNVLHQRIRKYGLTDKRVIDAPWPGRPSKNRTGNPRW